MNSRLKKLLVGVVLGSVLLYSNVSKVEALPINEENYQHNGENVEGVLESIYSQIVDGNTSIHVSNDSKLGIRANIDVSENISRDAEKKVNNGIRTVSSTNSQEDSDVGSKIANFAKGLIGSSYVFGATGPNSFDCSGLIVYVYRKFGISLPRTSQSQAYVGKRVKKSELKPGDLVFSNTYGSLSHVGIYIGDGRFVHAANAGTGVTVSGVSDSYYGPRFAWATRPY